MSHDNTMNMPPRKKLHFFGKLRSRFTFNIISGIVILLVVFSLIAIAIGYWQFSDRFTEEYSDNAVRIAQAAESYLPPESLDAYLNLGEGSFDDSGYAASYVSLQQLCDKVNAQFIYVIKPDTTDYGHIRFVMNIVNTDSGFERYHVGYVRETTNDDYREKYRRLYEEGSQQEIVVRDKGFIESGSHITAMIPIRDDNGEVAGILCVQRQMDALTTSRVTFTIRVILALGIMILIAAFLYGFLLNRSLIRPIKRITKETARFAGEPSKAEEPLSASVRSRDEIGLLAHSVDKMEEDTLDYIDHLTQMTAEQQRIGTELDLAAQIQQGSLNTVFPEREEFEIFASMTPAKEVGGDFYDFFMIDDDHMCLVIADVSGKGIPAALFMMISKIVICDVAMGGASPQEILRIVNERICQNNRLDMFVTVWLGILELSTGRLTAANAGHEYPYVCRSGGVFELLRDKHGFVIGGMSGMKYSEYELTLGAGDTIFVYTDGLPEATDGDETIFGVDRMTEALNLSPDAAPAELLPKVKAQVDAFVGDAPQFDDLTMLSLRYKGRKDAPSD